MRRLLFITILGVAGVGVIVFLVSLFWVGSASGVGKLTVVTQPTGLQIYVDNEYIGASPIENFSVESGNVEVRIGEAWREKISISSNVTSVINRTINSDRSSVGFAASYEAIRTLFNQGSHVVLTSIPSGVEVFNGDELVGLTPLVLSDASIGKTKYTFKRSGYEPYEIDTSVESDTILRIEVSLRADPLANLQKVSFQGGLVNEPQRESPKINPRSSWGGDSFDTTRHALTLSPWGQLEVWGVEAEVDEMNSYLVQLDSLVKRRDELPGIPFAYIIDDNGSVYEGMGILDFDFSSLSQQGALSFSSGIAPVLVLSDKGVFDTQVIKDALLGLITYFEQEPIITASLLTEIETVTLPGGEVRSIELQYQNTSPLIWRKDSFYKMEIRLVDKDMSEIYDPDTWLSPVILTGMEESEVLPGEVATFRFNVRAPFYTSTFNDQIGLYSSTQEMFATSEKVSISVQVQGSTNNAVRILDTPTGFLNVRSGPGINFELLTTVFPGEAYAWVQEQNGWYQIIMRDGAKGWITRDYTSPL
jgi:hypothetical protein